MNLNFPKYSFKLRKENERLQICDNIRKKWVALTPEEWVRQHIIRYLVEEKKVPKSLIAIEMGIKVNDTSKRCDVVVYDSSAKPLLIVECKAPDVEITQKTFDQAAGYNLTLKVDYLLITNGISHHFCKVDFESKKYVFYNEIPCYEDINRSS